MIFTTISGSKYEIKDGLVRRVNPGYTKRADGEWVRLINTPIVEIGEPVLLTMDSLSEYGADDYGTPPEDSSPYTTRVTSLVSSIEEGA